MQTTVFHTVSDRRPIMAQVELLDWAQLTMAQAYPLDTWQCLLSQADALVQALAQDTLTARYRTLVDRTRLSDVRSRAQLRLIRRQRCHAIAALAANLFDR